MSLLGFSALSFAPSAARAVDDAPAQQAEDTIEIAARVFGAQDPVFGTTGVGLSGVWLREQRYGFGAQVTAFYVGNSSDGGSFGELDRGLHGVVFAEGDLFPGWITPYARLGLGAGTHSRWTWDPWTSYDLAFVAEIEAGAALRLGPLVVRAWVGPAFFGRDLLFPYGVQIGGQVPTP